MGLLRLNNPLAMAFTPRQIHCLHAMGITPWVQKSVLKQVERSGYASLAQRLRSQPLLTFTARGMQMSSLGPSSAALLIVNAVKNHSEENTPLGTQATELFDLMMRAIELSKSHYRLCAITEQYHDAPIAETTASASSLCNSQTRAIVFLDPSCEPDKLLDSAEDAAENIDYLPLESSSVPIWHLIHPELLLEKPQYKRQAWETLKQLKLSLDKP